MTAKENYLIEVHTDKQFAIEGLPRKIQKEKQQLQLLQDREKWNLKIWKREVDVNKDSKIKQIYDLHIAYLLIT